jgi:hypothetical protein
MIGFLMLLADTQRLLTVNIDWPTWSGKTRNTDAATANMLVFSTDKEKYAVGENAQISFHQWEDAFLIENGSKVVQTLWARPKRRNQSYHSDYGCYGSKCVF